MKLIIKNNTKDYVKLVLNQESDITIESMEQYFCEVNTNDNTINIDLINHQESFFVDDKYHLLINLKARCHIQDGAIIIIEQKMKLFQNSIFYKYFILTSSECRFYDLSHSVTNCSEMLKIYNQHNKSKGALLSHILMNIIDTLYIGGIISVVLFFLYNYKVALLFIGGLFVFITTINLFIKRLHKSKIRLLNWLKDTDSADDLPYFIKRINSFCRN